MITPAATDRTKRRAGDPVFVFIHSFNKAVIIYFPVKITWFLPAVFGDETNGSDEFVNGEMSEK